MGRMAYAPRETRADLGSDDQLVAVGIDGHSVALGHGGVEDGGGQPVTDLPLDHPLERPRPEGRVVALPGHDGTGRRGHLEADATGRQALAQVLELDVDDRFEAVRRQGYET